MHDMNKDDHINDYINKRELIKTLILSPLYWRLKLKERSVLVHKMIPRK
jgi:hypothetical protein